MRALLFIVAFACSAPLWAERFVVGFSGDASQYRIERAGRAIPVRALTVLEPGDLIAITGADGSLVTIDGRGSELRIDPSNSPYTVPKEPMPSWLDNLMREALVWYHGLGGRPEQVIAVISRGEGEPPRLLGMDAPENLVPAAIDELHLFWSGAEAPYRLAIEGGGRVVWEVGPLAASPARTGSLGLGEGPYRVRISARVGTGRQGEELPFMVVATDLLPESVQAIRAAGLPQRTQAALMAIRLATYPQWRFAALQYAAIAGDQPLQQALLAGLSPADAGSR